MVSCMIWYAKTFGISDLDIAEESWVAEWIKRHGNNLCYNPMRFVWEWVE